VLFVTHQIDEAQFLQDQVIVFSARSSSIKDIADIKPERPSPLFIKRDSKFLEYVDRIWVTIEQEAKITTAAKKSE
jgi:NitT/TauT family transport system ATP-binding protein